MIKSLTTLTLISSLGTLFSACANAVEFNLPDPAVITIAPMKKAVKLDSTYLTLKENPAISGGFLIDARGINYPAIHLDGEKPNIWQFPFNLNNLFIFKNVVMVGDAKGQVYRFDNPSWTMTTIKLKPNSKILSSTNDIIACTTYYSVWF